jgi:hypothetical protein
VSGNKALRKVSELRTDHLMASGRLYITMDPVIYIAHGALSGRRGAGSYNGLENYLG